MDQVIQQDFFYRLHSRKKILVAYEKWIIGFDSWKLLYDKWYLD